MAQLLYRAGLGLNARSRWAEAEAALREALDLQREFNASPESIAGSLKALGYSLEWQYRFDDATKLLDEARILFAEADDALGEVNCIKSLGDIAFRRSDHATAQARYEEALPLYRRVDSVFGEANCIQSLSDIALAEERPEEARKMFLDALQLYERIPEPYSIGWTRIRLARLAPTPAERDEHLKAAREAWKRIDRPDLIEGMEKEFNITEGNDAKNS